MEPTGNPNFHMPNRLPNSDRIKHLTSAYKIREGDYQIQVVVCAKSFTSLTSRPHVESLPKAIDESRWYSSSRE